MSTKDFRKVSKAEFDEYNASLGVDLVRNVNRCYEPPLLTVNDFSTGKVWPESVVSYAMLSDEKEAYYNFEPPSYYIP